MTIQLEFIPFDGHTTYAHFPHGRFLVLTNAGTEVVVNTPVTNRYGVVFTEHAFGGDQYKMPQRDILAYMPADSIGKAMVDAMKAEVGG